MGANIKMNNIVPNEVLSFYYYKALPAWPIITGGFASEHLLGKQTLQLAQPYEILQHEF